MTRMVPSFGLLAAAAALGFALGTATAAATPNVTAVALTNGCASLPNYNATSGEAGPWIAVADSTGKPIDGFGDIPVYSTAVGGFRWGLIAIPASNAANKTSLRCTNASIEAYLDMGVQGITWTPVQAYGDSTDASLGFGYPSVPDTPLPVEPYAHVIDGVKQPGVFLGSQNVTLWGFNYQNSADEGWGEYYSVRLLLPGSNSLTTGTALNEGEFTGFIKISA